ncbi:ALDH-like protein [Rickenella mellea]|uniref:ALDH-like protein n=1 Tax=Rickenella mellea TaxID=50990 RepID=A0A4Y7QCJ4_9AGAM|nr:ALDH-like protein [Rickenella mellea]
MLVAQPSMDIPRALLWINGRTRAASTNHTFEVHNPLRKKIVSVCASATSEDCKDAVEAAAHAFTTWEQVNPAEMQSYSDYSRRNWVKKIPLICGNTVVVKSSEYIPRSQAIAVEVMHEAGILPGVLNLISMSRENAPKLTTEIIGNPHVRHINFTGSDSVGKIIAAEAAKYLKPCVFELGGKTPAVVLDDANIPEAAQSIALGAMLHSGQVCVSTERVIVQRNIAAALQSELVAICGRLKAGDHINDPSVNLSCLFSESSAANVLSTIEEAASAGAQVLLGDMKRDGAVIQPHVLSGVKPGMRAWDRESFGPVIVIAVVDTVDEAVDLANASDY